MKTKILLLIAIITNVAFTLAKAQLTQAEVRKIDVTLANYLRLYPNDIGLIKHQAFCIVSPTKIEDHKEPIEIDGFYDTVTSIHVKNRYTKREFKNVIVRVNPISTISNDDAYTTAVGFSWTVVVPLFTYLAKGVTDASDAARAKSEIQSVLNDLYYNPYNLCENLANNGDLNIEDLPEY